VIVSMDYQGQSGIVNHGTNAKVAFATNTLREATYLRGTLSQPVLFREALAAMYHVVVSDYKYRPKDRLEFRAWLEAQDRKFLANLGVKSQQARAKLELCEARRAELDKARLQRLRPFHEARRAYFDFMYEKDYVLQLLLDPVITIHPDEVSFEAFSRDESAYARLAVPYNHFEKIDAFECGTTNIDFSPRLHKELERIRTYRRTEFNIEPSGLSVSVGAAAVHKEKKIDLPDSWVNGFLQVHSTMTLGLTHVEMAPVDLFNICRFLRRHKTRISPRALRYEMLPGERVKVVLEPWDHVIELGECSRFVEPKAHSIRTWGRNRLQILRRLLPVCKHVDVYLAGYGMPSIYILDLGGITFTLALSGWTDNDWTAGANFELLSRRTNASAAELTQTYDALRKVRYANEQAIAAATGLGVERSRSALSFLCQAGRAMYDLKGRVFRHRELFLTPFSAQEAVALAKQTAASSNPQEQAAQAILKSDNVRIIARRPVTGGYKLSGSAKGSDNHRVRPLLHVDLEGHIIEASCTCPFFKKSKLTQGPCEHILALRLAHMSRLEKEDQS
jgi:hypothetical protein